ncbi:MAG: hypothetical protein KatS3mg023_3708 [Armatimonadota bacterium]|nr:MAG: hypothetical protein KatS3mg023_3708 [Armatimonadota bacterium]
MPSQLDNMQLFLEAMDNYRPSNQVDEPDRYSYKWAFSGADIHAYIGNRKVANLVALSVSINREIAPIYTFGDPSPRTFVKGKRGIAGTMTFTQFDKHALIESVFNVGEQIKDLWEHIDRFYGHMADQQFKDRVERLRQYANLSDQQLQALTAEQYVVASAARIVAQRRIQYVDQLPPFDLTLVFINENGAFAYMALLGVQFANEGYGYTLDDLSSATAVTYVATGVRPLTNKLQSLDQSFSGAGSRMNV